MRSPIRILKLFGALTKLVLNPTALDEVFEMGANLRKMVRPEERELVLAAAHRDAGAAQAFRDRPRLGKVDFFLLSQLPEHTLGGAYARFMKERQISQDAIPTINPENDMEYLVAHLYETHDIWHVLTGFEIDTAGELGLQAFYLARYPAPLSTFILIAGLLNTVIFHLPELHRVMGQIANGWTLGRNARDLTGVDWKLHWSTPLAELRERHGIARSTPPVSAVAAPALIG